MFYPDMAAIPQEDLQKACDYMVWFLNCGDEGDNRRRPKLMDWEQDFQYIVAPINRVVGCEVRAADYLHWWTFISAYYEIGDCLFAQIVRIRQLNVMLQKNCRPRKKCVDITVSIRYNKKADLCGQHYGSLVKRLRHRPLTPVTRVRFPHESP